MGKTKEIFSRIGLGVPEIYLPAKGTDYRTWAVVACDQYSSERDYWENVKKTVGTAPSTLNVIFPECYLEDADKEKRIESIKAAMKDYLAKGVVENRGPGFILVERFTPFEKHPRKGLMMAVDLEKYQYGKESKSMIRPTEGTIVERLPPRMQIRRGAPLELPHIMLLIDDPTNSVLGPIYAKRDSLPKLYDFTLMSDSGTIKGYHVNAEADIDAMAAALEKLADASAFEKKYGQKDVLLFAVGDGNHSLATAKATWEEIKAAAKSPAELEGHPARYALVELVNIYDEGLPFHPIHRVLFKADEAKFFADIKKYQDCSIDSFPTKEKAFAFADEPTKEHRIAFVSSKGAGVIRFTKPKANLAAGTIQEFLDGWLKANPGTGIDYIHGTESLATLATQAGNLGLYLPPIDKGGFFGTVIRDGVMPRKTFSMGEAPEKRFYIEARRITR